MAAAALLYGAAVGGGRGLAAVAALLYGAGIGGERGLATAALLYDAAVAGGRGLAAVAAVLFGLGGFALLGHALSAGSVWVGLVLGMALDMALRAPTINNIKQSDGD